MLKKISIWLFSFLLVLNLSGCALILGLIAQSQEVKQEFSVSYIQALLMVKEALKTEQIQFENATIYKNSAKVKGIYPDGKTVHIVIYKISDTESNVTVRVGTSQAGAEDAQKIMSTIRQYSFGGKKE